MQAAVLDTLRCAQTLKTAGFPPEQAEASAQVLGDALSDVATKTDLERHAAMQKADLERVAAERKADLESLAAERKADLERVAAEWKADLERVEAKLDNAVANLNTKIDTAVAGVRSELRSEVGRLETKIDAMDQKIDGVEQKLGEKIDDKFDALNRNILLLGGFVLIVVGAVMAFAFNVMEPRIVASGEPHVTTHTPAQSTSAADARPASPEPLAEAARATPPTSPPPQDAPSGRVNGHDTSMGGSL